MKQSKDTVVPDEYAGLSQRERIACLQNRHRIRAERLLAKRTSAKLSTQIEQLESRFRKMDPQAYLKGLKVVLEWLEQMEADGNVAAHDMAVVARGKLARMEYEEGLEEEV